MCVETKKMYSYIGTVEICITSYSLYTLTIPCYGSDHQTNPILILCYVSNVILFLPNDLVWNCFPCFDSFETVTPLHLYCVGQGCKWPQRLTVLCLRCLGGVWRASVAPLNASLQAGKLSAGWKTPLTKTKGFILEPKASCNGFAFFSSSKSGLRSLQKRSPRGMIYRCYLL